MPQTDPIRRYIDAAIAFTEITRSRAEEIVNELIRAGEVQREQTQQWVDDLVDRSRRNTEALVELVRHELREQLHSMSVVTAPDLVGLEQRVNELTGRLSQLANDARTWATEAASAVVSTSGRSRPGKRTTTKKAAARKTAAGRTTARKTTARKAPAAKKSATRTAAKKTTGAKKTAARATAAGKTGARKATGTKKAGAGKSAAKRSSAAKKSGA